MSGPPNNNNNGIVIDASGLFRKIAAIQKGARPEPYLRAIGLRIMGWIDQNFKMPMEHSWPPLSPNTIAQRRKSSSAPLQDTGRLRMSWTRAGGNPRILGAHTVEVSSNIKYANYHQFGTGPYVIRPKKPGGRLKFGTAGGTVYAREVHHPGIPKRQMTPGTETTRRLAIGTLQAAIDRMLANARAQS